MAHLEDNNDTEEIDPRYEAKDGEDADVVRVVQPKFGRAPEYCHHNPNLKIARVSAYLTYFQLQRSSRNRKRNRKIGVPQFFEAHRPRGGRLTSLDASFVRCFAF